MRAYSEELYFWSTNKEWYGIADDGSYFLKENAPEKAKQSFEKWKKATAEEE